MKLLNERHSYGLKLVLLSIDEGITGYRDDSLETVKRNQQQYDLPLIILTYKELYGWSMVGISAVAMVTKTPLAILGRNRQSGGSKEQL